MRIHRAIRLVVENVKRGLKIMLSEINKRLLALRHPRFHAQNIYSKEYRSNLHMFSYVETE